MFPGMNPRELQKAMQRLGMKQESIDAVEVIIRTREKEIVIENPQVAKVNLMGKETWQIIGEAKERSVQKELEITEEDIKTVMEKTKVSKEKAKKALEKAEGDLAEAILSLS